MITQEDLYKLIQNKEWEELITLIHENSLEISSDILLKQASDVFIKEFLKEVGSCPSEDRNTIILENLESIYLLNKGGFYTLKEEDCESVACEITKCLKYNLPMAYNYAKDFPNNNLCNDIILQYEKTISQEIKHSQSDKIQVTEKKVINNVDYRINLLKSIQEEYFFMR